MITLKPRGRECRLIDAPTGPFFDPDHGVGLRVQRSGGGAPAYLGNGEPIWEPNRIVQPLVAERTPAEPATPSVPDGDIWTKSPENLLVECDRREVVIRLDASGGAELPGMIERLPSGSILVWRSGNGALALYPHDAGMGLWFAATGFPERTPRTPRRGEVVDYYPTPERAAANPRLTSPPWSAWMAWVTGEGGKYGHGGRVLPLLVVPPGREPFAVDNARGPSTEPGCWNWPGAGERAERPEANPAAQHPPGCRHSGNPFIDISHAIDESLPAGVVEVRTGAEVRRFRIDGGEEGGR